MKICKYIKKLFKKDKDSYTPIVNSEYWSDFEVSILNKINTHRVTLGLSKLLPEEAGWITAKNRLDVQIQFYIDTNNISHNQIETVVTELLDKGFNNITEVLGVGYSSPTSVVKAWIKSNRHNKALTGSYKYAGVSHGKEDNRDFYVIVFYN